MTASAPSANHATQARRIVGQSGLLFAGFAATQACSFLRNALLGHALSRGDFGTAATLTLTLQLVDTLSDPAVDRFVVQARREDAARHMASAHLLLLARGVAMALLLFLVAAPLSTFFGLPSHVGLFQAIAVIPLIKGLVHLDPRRQQRNLDNRGFLAVETGAQLLALVLTPVLLWLRPDPSVAVWLALAQALAMVAISHVVARTRYTISGDRAALGQQLRFGWPIWLSALPLVAVYQADRALVGHMLGVEALAAYSAAFMIAMVPGLIAAKIGHALMLPLLAEARATERVLAMRYRVMLQATLLLAVAYVTVFVIAGGDVLVVAFGRNFERLGPVVGCLAVMWSLRIVQAVPGMALMALGDSRPLPWAALVRALALPGVLAVLMAGGSLVTVAAMGILGELASLALVAHCVAKRIRVPAATTALLTLLLVPVLGVADIARDFLPHGYSHAIMLTRIAAAMAIAGLVVAILVLAMPELRRWLRSLIGAASPPIGERR